MRRINHLIVPTFGAVILSFIAGFLLQHPTHAAEQTISLTAAPAILEASGNTGSETPLSFQLTNNGALPLPIHISSQDSQVKEGQSVELVQELSAKEWIVFEEPDFILLSGQTKIIEAHLRIPDGASGGGHYADIIAQSLSIEGTNSIIEAKPEIAIQLLVNVGGTITEDVYIGLEGPSTMFAQRSSKHEVSFSAKNRGNTHSLLNVWLVVLKNDSTLFTTEVRPIIILPSENKRITFQLPEFVRPDVYQAQVKYSYGTVKESNAPKIHIIVPPFSPLFLLTIPLVIIATLSIRARRRIALAIKTVVRGE